MPGERKNKRVQVRLGPPLAVSVLLLAIGGAALGYVWQKNVIDTLQERQRDCEKRYKQVCALNERLANEVARLHQPVNLEVLARKLNLGLAPVQPGQMVALPEWSETTADSGAHRWADRSVAAVRLAP